MGVHAARQDAGKLAPQMTELDPGRAEGQRAVCGQELSNPTEDSFAPGREFRALDVRTVGLTS